MRLSYFVLSSLMSFGANAQTYDLFFNGYSGVSRINSTPLDACNRWAQEFNAHYSSIAELQSPEWRGWMDWFAATSQSLSRYASAGQIMCRYLYRKKMETHGLNIPTMLAMLHGLLAVLAGKNLITIWARVFAFQIKSGLVTRTHASPCWRGIKIYRPAASGIPFTQLLVPKA